MVMFNSYVKLPEGKLNEEMIHDNHEKDGITGIPGQMQGYKPFCTKHVTHSTHHYHLAFWFPRSPRCATCRLWVEWEGEVIETYRNIVGESHKPKKSPNQNGPGSRDVGLACKTLGVFHWTRTKLIAGAVTKRSPEPMAVEEGQISNWRCSDMGSTEGHPKWMSQ